MHRFFIPAELLNSQEIALPRDISRQISRVLRLKAGDLILLLDDHGFEYPSTLQMVSDTASIASIQTKEVAQGEPVTRLRLVLGLTQREKFELILQKCTEVGVTEFLPVITSRTLIQKRQDAEDKYPRWQKIIREAAEQSCRGRIPALQPVSSFTQALQQMDTSLKLVLWEDEQLTNIREKIRGYSGNTVTMIVGPEGGLSTEEVHLACQNGFIPVSLGRRILRMETAAILAAGIVFYELE